MVQAARRGQAPWEEGDDSVLGQTIVCGVDGSASAAGAVTFARLLSEWLEWHLVVVHIAQVPMVPGASGIPSAHDELRDVALDEGDALLESVVEDHPLAASVERRVELGHPVEGLVAVCDEENADLLVVGSRGRGRIASALRGSVSTGVLGRASCAVVIVPESASISRAALDVLEQWPKGTIERLAFAAPRRA
jgi:nucleotide-binding universal stress UspA family protein